MTTAAQEYQAKVKPLEDDYWVRRKPLDDAYWVRRKPRNDYWAKVKALRDAMTAYMPELEALHAQLCTDCPWDGTTIFSEGAA